MSGGAEHWLGPGEMAKRLGVTPKALRVYEREGLVRPMRAESGWRAYGPAEAARLHQVMALRDLGLTLKQIKALLDGDRAGLETVLALQERALEAQRRRLDGAITLLQRARAKLGAGQPLSLDDLTNLTEGTIMQTSGMKKFGETIRAHLAEEMPDGKAEAMIERVRQLRPGLDPERVKAEFVDLLVEARKLLDERNRNEEAVKAMIRRVRTQWPNPGSLIGEEERAAVRAAFEKTLQAPADSELASFDLSALKFLQDVAREMRAKGEFE
jgi:MerR family transcriptional regulator, thiopeptide resistance regulator